MRIGGLEKLSLIDYPAKIAATIFTAGCNFRCGYCHNGELVDLTEAKKHPNISEKNVFDFLNSRQGLLDGVCLTGGEPTSHSDLPSFIKKIKQLGFLVKLDTNGSNPEMLKKLLEENLLDFMAMDIKASREKYPETTGPTINLDNIQKSVSLIKESGLNYEFRTTIFPPLIDEKELKKIGQWIEGAECFVLQQFRPEKTLDKTFQEIKPYSEDKLKILAKIIEPFVERVLLR